MTEDFIQIKGGEGSGWFAPPKGNHTRRSFYGQFTHRYASESEAQLHRYQNEIEGELDFWPYIEITSERKIGSKTGGSYCPDDKKIRLDEARLYESGPNATTISHEVGHAFDYEKLNGAWDLGDFSRLPPNLRQANHHLAEKIASNATYQEWCRLSRTPKEVGSSMAKFYKNITKPGEIFAIVFSQHFSLKLNDKSTVRIPDDEFPEIDKALTILCRELK